MPIFWNKQVVNLLGLALGLLVVPATGAAQTLPELWERLATSEPALLAAKAQARAAVERTNQSFAQFLPQVNLTANTTHNHREYQTTGAFANFSNDWYNSHGVQLNVTQSLWRQVNHVAHNQALAAAEQAVHQYLATQQDLQSKLVAAWAEALYARDALQAARSLEAATNQNLTTYERGFALGVYSATERDEAKAKRQQSTSDRYAAESELFARHTVLEQLVGALPAIGSEHVNVQLQKIPFGTLAPLATFTDTLEQNNPIIKAAEKGLKVAQEEVRKQQAQHGPTLDLVAGVGRNAQPSAGTTPGQAGFKSRLDTVGLQFNLPLYSGGSQTSKVREAVALESKAAYELDAAKRNALNLASQAWAQLRSAQAKLDAAEVSLTAAQSAERLAILGQKSGLKTVLDELQAKQLVEAARRDARRAYYDNVIGMAKLLTATGAMEEYTLQDIQQRLKTPTAFAEIPLIGL